MTTATNDENCDPLVKEWTTRVAAAKKHWSRHTKRADYARKLVRGIDDKAEPNTAGYSAQRANLLQSTLTVVLSKVYAKNPDMIGLPTNKSRDLKLFAHTLTTVTQAMLDDAKLKKQAKRAVKAALVTNFGFIKLQYQRDLFVDPIIQSRISDTQDNIARIDALIAGLDNDSMRETEEVKRVELEQTLAGLEATPEVVAAEGLVLDVVRTGRLWIDPAVEDVWDYEQAEFIVESIPMAKMKAMGLFKGVDLSTATLYKAAHDSDDDQVRYLQGTDDENKSGDAMVCVHEVWHKADNRVYTLIEGLKGQFARAPYSPTKLGERWYPYFVLPFQSVDGNFTAQSLVDSVEILQNEHNAKREKENEICSKINPHMIVRADVDGKSIRKVTSAAIGEYVTLETEGRPVGDMIQQAPELRVDPALTDTSKIMQDWQEVTGLQDAARSVVVKPKTATEANIMEQSLGARVSEFRDQVEDWLTDMAQYASELCLLNMTDAQVAQIMGQNPAPAMPEFASSVGLELPNDPPEQADEVYEWPGSATPESVFNLVQIKIRSGSTGQPNKLDAQDVWTRAMPMLQQMIAMIRQIEQAGGDATPERELVKETAARFDDSIDVDRFLPPKPVRQVLPMMPPSAAQGQPLPPQL